MSEIVPNQSKTKSSAFDWFVLSFCLLVPTIGTLVFFILMDHLRNDRLAVGGAACVYLSSAILGLFSAKRFKVHHEPADFWALIVGIAMCGVSGSGRGWSVDFDKCGRRTPYTLMLTMRYNQRPPPT